MTSPISPKRTALLAAARERILVLDGAMGTMIQGLQYDEAAFRGTRFADFHRDVRGNNDLLILTQPEAIEDIHAAYLRAGADIVATNTFSSRRRRARQRRGRQAAFRRGRAGPDQPHRIDLARRFQSRLSRRHLR
jgi:methionine synthase I (cobalamin-dependent)